MIEVIGNLMCQCYPKDKRFANPNFGKGVKGRQSRTHPGMISKNGDFYSRNHPNIFCEDFYD